MTISAFSGTSRKPYYFFLALAVTAIGAVIIARFLTEDLFTGHLQEGGLVETFSALGYLTCVLVIVILGGARFALRQANLLLLLLFLCSRELDFDKRFTTMGIFKTRFYVSPDVPLLEKAAGVIVILILGWAVTRFLVQHGGALRRALFRFEPAALAAALAIACMAVAKTFDGIQRKLAPWGIEISADLSRILTEVEEILELGIPLFFLLAAIAYFGIRPEHRRQTVANQDQARIPQTSS